MPARLRRPTDCTSSSERSRSDLDLAKKPIGPEGSGQIGTQDLYRHLAVVLHILGEIDSRHAAGAEFAFDLVFAGEGGREAGEDVSHLPRAGEWPGIVFVRRLKPPLGGLSVNRR